MSRVPLGRLICVLLAVVVALVSVGDYDGNPLTRDVPSVTAATSVDDPAPHPESGMDDHEPESVRVRRSARRIGLLREVMSRSRWRLSHRWHSSFLAHPPI